MKKVSIIVPIYNTSKYLIECLESLIKQSYQNIEIILIDDGSTDESFEICSKYESNYSFIKVKQKNNGGLSSARNAGLAIATGDYISFVDSDDYVSPTFIENLVNAMNDGDADVVVSNFTCIDEHNNAIFRESPIKNETLSSKALLNKLIENNYYFYVCTVNKLYKKEIFKNISFKEGRIHEDEFLINALIKGDYIFKTIENCDYFYRQVENSIMHRKVDIRRLDAVDAFLERAKIAKSLKIKKNYKINIKNASQCLLQCCHNVDCFAFFKVTFKRLIKTYKPFCIRSCIYKLPIAFAKSFFKGCINSIKIKLLKKKIGRLRRANKKIVFILGTPVHGNLGDQAIVYAEKKMLIESGINKKSIIEIDNTFLILNFQIIVSVIDSRDLVVIDGGGNLGILWPWENEKILKILEKCFDSTIIIFPQTCFYGNLKKTCLEKDYQIMKKVEKLYVFLRDKKSYEIFNTNFPDINSYLCPDVVLSLRRTRKKISKKKILICMREDVEKNTIIDIRKELTLRNADFDVFSTIVNKKVNKINRKKEIKKLFKVISKAKFVITDRMHSLIFSYLCSTPCLVIDNISHKVSGALEWIKDNNNYCLYSDKTLDLFLTKKICFDNNEKDFCFEKLYSKIVGLLKEWINGYRE